MENFKFDSPTYFAFGWISSAHLLQKQSGNLRKYTEFVGYRFLSHPLRCSVTLKKAKEHPILHGVEESFDIRDEHYQIEVLAEDADIILTSFSETGGVQTAGYTQTIFLNAAAWCLGEKEPGDEFIFEI